MAEANPVAKPKLRFQKFAELITQPGKRKWIEAARKLKIMNSITRSINSKRTAVTTSYLNLNTTQSRVTKVLLKVIKELTEGDEIEIDGKLEALKKDDIQRDATAAADRFSTDDLVIIEYGKQWSNHSELCFKIAERHAPRPANVLTSKFKTTLRLLEQDQGVSAADFQQDLFGSGDDDARSILVPYFRKAKGKKLYVQAKGEPLLEDYFKQTLVEIGLRKQRNAASRRSQNSDNHVPQMFEKMLAITKTTPPPPNLGSYLDELERHIIKYANALLGQLNLGSLLRSMRDAGRYMKMIELLNAIPPEFKSIRNSRETQMYEVAAYHKLGRYEEYEEPSPEPAEPATATGGGSGDGDDGDDGAGDDSAGDVVTVVVDDQLKAATILKTILDSESSLTSSAPLQFLKGNIFKALFCASCQYPDRYTLAQKEEFYESAGAAFEFLARQRVALTTEESTDRSTNLVNLVLLHYLGLTDNVEPRKQEATKLKLFQAFDSIYGQLAFQVKGGNCQPFEAAALLLLSIVAIHHFTKTGSKQTHYQTATAAATALFEGWHDKEQLRQCLDDAKLLHETSKERSDREGESSEKIVGLDFWIQILQEALDDPTLKDNDVDGGRNGSMPATYNFADGGAASPLASARGRRLSNIDIPNGANAGGDTLSYSHSMTAFALLRGEFNRSPVLFGEVAKVGTGELNKLVPMFLSKEREQKGLDADVGDGGSTLRRRRTSQMFTGKDVNLTGSFDPYNDNTSPQPRSGSLGKSSGLNSLEKRANVEYLLQLTPAGGERANLETIPVKRIKQLQDMDMSHRFDRSKSDKRRILLYIGIGNTAAAASAGGHAEGAEADAGESKAYVLVFSSEFRRDAFWDMCKASGYVAHTGSEETELYSLDYQKIQFDLIDGDDESSDSDCGDVNGDGNDDNAGDGSSDDDGAAAMDGEKSHAKRVVLGEGTFATVYQGSRVDTWEKVAIKMLKREFAEDLVTVAMFTNEGTTLAGFHHPNIIKFRGASEHKHSDSVVPDKYLLIELVEGGSLEELLTTFGPLYNPNFEHESCVAIATYTKQMLKALEYLHHKEFTHRDIKPENVLVSKVNGQVKLADFGTLIDLQGLDTTTTDLAGSISFMDRRVLLQKKYGVEVDIFSLGATVFKLASGTIPFTANNQTELLDARRQQSDDVVLHDAWPDELRSFIDDCLAKAETRKTATELLQHDFLTTYASEENLEDDMFDFEKEGAAAAAAAAADDDDAADDDAAFPGAAGDALDEDAPLAVMTCLLRDYASDISEKWARALDNAELLTDLKEREFGDFLSEKRLKLIAERRPETAHDLQCMLDPRLVRSGGNLAQCNEVVDTIKTHHENGKHGGGKRKKAAADEILRSAVGLLATFCEEQYREDDCDDEHLVGHLSARNRVIELIAGKGASKAQSRDKIERSGIFVTALSILKFPAREDIADDEDALDTDDDGGGGGNTADDGGAVVNAAAAAAAGGFSRSSSPVPGEHVHDGGGGGGTISAKDAEAAAAAAVLKDEENVTPTHFWGCFLRKSAELTQAPHKLWQTMKEFNDMVAELQMLIAPMTHTPKRATLDRRATTFNPITHGKSFVDTIGRVDSASSEGGYSASSYSTNHGNQHVQQYNSAQMDKMAQNIKNINSKLDTLLDRAAPPSVESITSAVQSVVQHGGDRNLDGGSGVVDAAALRSLSSPVSDDSGGEAAASCGRVAAAGAAEGPKKCVSFLGVYEATQVPAAAEPPTVADVAAVADEMPVPPRTSRAGPGAGVAGVLQAEEGLQEGAAAVGGAADGSSRTILSVVSALLSRPELHQKLAAYIERQGMTDDLFVDQSTEVDQLHDIATAMIELHPDADTGAGQGSAVQSGDGENGVIEVIEDARSLSIYAGGLDGGSERVVSYFSNTIPEFTSDVAVVHSPQEPEQVPKKVAKSKKPAKPSNITPTRKSSVASDV